MQYRIEDFYKTEDYDKLFAFFFEIYIVVLTKGMASDDFESIRQEVPELTADTDKKVSKYLFESTSFLGEGYAPSLISLLLDHLDIKFAKESISIEQLHMMRLSRCLIEALHQFNIDILMFDMPPLWSKTTKKYAETYFYPRLPEDLKRKYCK